MENLTNFKEFLLKYSTLRIEFIESFYKFFDVKDYDDTATYIDYNIVIRWLDIDKRNFKDTLINNFKKNIDYKIKKDKQKFNSMVIYITAKCFKEYCMA